MNRVGNYTLTHTQFQNCIDESDDCSVFFCVSDYDESKQRNWIWFILHEKSFAYELMTREKAFRHSETLPPSSKLSTYMSIKTHPRVQPNTRARKSAILKTVNLLIYNVKHKWLLLTFLKFRFSILLWIALNTDYAWYTNTRISNTARSRIGEGLLLGKNIVIILMIIKEETLSFGCKVYARTKWPDR